MNELNRLIDPQCYATLKLLDGNFVFDTVGKTLHNYSIERLIFSNTVQRSLTLQKYYN